MEIITSADFKIEAETVVAIGKFDGFHLGHQKLLNTVKEQSKKGLKAVAFTFVPSPATFFTKKIVPELSTIEEKRNIFEKANIDYLIEYPFCQEIADMDPVEYIKEVLVKAINAKCIVAGEDVSFGKKGLGNYELLKQYSEEFGYKVILIDKVLYGDKEISSTLVRDEVKNGNMKTVSELLGNPYSVEGEIVHGRALGRTIGMPTVNIIPDNEKLLPPKGVYYSTIEIENKKYKSITNIGTKPTVEGTRMGVETYIYDFNEDAYNKYAKVCLLEFKRPEMKFEDIEALKQQMQSDIEAGRQYILHSAE